MTKLSLSSQICLIEEGLEFIIKHLSLTRIPYVEATRLRCFGKPQTKQLGRR